VAELTKALVGNWCSQTTGEFHYKSILDGQINKDSFGKLRKQVFELVQDGVIVRAHNKRDGYYRLADKADEELMWWEGDDIDDKKVNLWLPFGLSKAVYISRPAIVTVSGDTNAGKSAVVLNILHMSTLKESNFKNNAVLLMSEGMDLLKGKMSKLYNNGIPNPPPFKTFRKVSNFEDDVLPNGLTVIDYLRPPNSESLMSIGTKLEAIYSKLDTGIAVVAMQKPRGEKPEAYGGIITQWDANLAISVYSNFGGNPYIKLSKIKKPILLDRNLYELKIGFEIHGGIVLKNEVKEYE